MAIKRGSKVDKSFASSSMTDLMFLLLLFLLIATTLISPNAIKLMLPKSSNVLKDRAMTTVSIEPAANGYRYYVELEQVEGVEGVEQRLQTLLSADDNATFSLHLDKSVPVDELVQMWNMSKKNGFQFILATSPN